MSLIWGMIELKNLKEISTRKAKKEAWKNNYIFASYFDMKNENKLDSTEIVLCIDQFSFDDRRTR